MSNDNIDKVDEMIRKNNIKYKDAQSQLQYQNALKEYEKQKKRQQLKQYAQIIKEGNRKAIEKAKAKSKMKKKKTVHKTFVNRQDESHVQAQQISKKPRLNQDQKKIIDQTIEARADRLMQEMHLNKINKQLEDQKKKTKLYELNQRCKKIFSKSTQKIIQPKSIPPQRMHILKQFQQKALQQIHELDKIIENIIEESNKNKTVPKIMKGQDHEEVQSRPKTSQNTQDIFLNLNHVLFAKSTEDLLKMDYIPI